MNVLFIHQNFPGQFKHLAPALAARGDRVTAFSPKVTQPTAWKGVNVLPYKVRGQSTRDIHPWLRDIETKVLRGTACFELASQIKAKGYAPDVIVAHHGWGESLFLKDVWPDARLGLYCEFYHQAADACSNFDPEFPEQDAAGEVQRMRLRNLNNRLHEEVMDAGLSPTRFQASTFPDFYRDRITVSHDGIDTDHVQKRADARLSLPGGASLTPQDEVVTFINRNLEPYRGYHVFMRALPDLLRQRPTAQVVILGGDDTSYGAKPTGDTSWKQIFLDEVRPKIAPTDWDRVHFLGHVPYDTYLAVLQVSSVHVYLTYPFVLSWSLMEAMSAECAIVASATPPVQEVITHGQTGVLFDFFDSKALVAETCALLDDPGRRAALGRTARQSVVDRYDLKRMCLPTQLAWVDALAQATPVRTHHV